MSANLNKGLNNYYKKNIKKFNSLISITFTGRCSLIEMVYLEEIPRSEWEQKSYKENIKEKYSIRADLSEA